MIKKECHMLSSCLFISKYLNSPEFEVECKDCNYDIKNSLDIKIKYHTNIDKIEKIKIGDWIDLRSAETIELKKEEFRLISLGISIQLPKGYESHIVPRSSTFKNFGIIQTNHCGIVDESYCGNSDIWMFPAYALRDTKINKNDRICQFRIVKKMEEICFIEVENLENENRGGFGSSGVK